MAQLLLRERESSSQEVGGNVEKALLGLLVEEESVGTRFKRSSHTIRGFLRGFVFK